LQGVAGCCGVLQCVAVCCSVLQGAAGCCSVLQCVAVLYSRGNCEQLAQVDVDAMCCSVL